MTASVYEPLPPDLLEADRDPAAPRRSPAPPLAPGLTASRWGPLSVRLTAPLAARARHAAAFAHGAVVDLHAARVLNALGADVAPMLLDRAGLHALRARAEILRHRASNFFERHPNATGAHLNAGLSDGFQWLDRGSNRWIDADRPEVQALRRALVVRREARHVEAVCDLHRPGWWTRLGLPTGRSEDAVLLVCEGVTTQLTPDALRAVLEEIGTHAPPGSRLLLDTVDWLAIGRVRRHLAPDEIATARAWRQPPWTAWLATAHPRLRVDGHYSVMAGYGGLKGWPYRMLGPWLHARRGAPALAITELGVDV